MRNDPDRPIRRLPRELSRFGRTPLERAAFFVLGTAAAFVIGRRTAGEAPATTHHDAMPLEVHGVARILDGDTIDVDGVRVRLFGIDAPEKDQSCARADGSRYACGDFATRALVSAVAGSPVTCARRDVDPYGRMVAVCSARGEDLGEQLVSAGAAMAYRRYSTDYSDAEDAARRSRAGIWQGAFDAPWDYRHKDRTAPRARDDHGAWPQPGQRETGNRK